jgi:hypothetical protein
MNGKPLTATPVIEVASADSGMHPRIFARIKRIALARRQAMLIAKLDQMIVSLGALPQPTGQFSVRMAQDIRFRLAVLRMDNPASVTDLEKIRKEIAHLESNLVVFDPALPSSSSTPTEI